MTDYPDSLFDFQRRFPDERACAQYLYELRWPDGFRCPRCSHDHAWSLETKAWTFECASCGRQTSVTARTIMHATKLSLEIWFWAAYLMATHSNGISALQLKKQLGLGSYKTAWLLCAKLRRAMVDPDRTALSGLVEVDESSIPHRTKDDPVAGGQGRSHDGKLLIAAAVESHGKGPGRVRLAQIADYSANSLHPFIAANISPATTVKTDGWPGYAATPDVHHDPHVIGATEAHLVLPWVHRVFSLLKTWGLGVYHGLRAKHLQAYLDEFVFRFNRRRTRHAGFRSLLAIGARLEPANYNIVIQPDAQG